VKVNTRMLASTFGVCSSSTCDTPLSLVFGWTDFEGLVAAIIAYLTSLTPLASTLTWEILGMVAERILTMRVTGEPGLEALPVKAVPEFWRA